MRPLFLFPLLLLALRPQLVAASAFTIDEWDLTVGVVGNGEFVNQIDADEFTSVQSPFSASHQAMVGSANSFAEYDFIFGETGSFRTETQQVSDVQDFQSHRSSVSGDIFVTAATDITISYDISYDYFLPTDSMTAQASFAVFEDGASTSLFSEFRNHNTILGLGPGTFSIQGEMLLAAGTTWRIDYFARLIADDSSAGGVGTGTGVFEFQLTPEPHSLWLLLVGAGLLVKPRRCFVV